jgi:hypothetical protein
MLLLVAGSANAVLFRVGPNNLPVPPGNGFPAWYQDFNGLVLDLCLPRNQAQLDSGACLILPTAQDPVAGIDLPFVFPTNFPDEVFHFRATSLINFPTGERAVLVLGLEAAFAGGGPAVNDQITFNRTRVTIGAPVAGTYTVTHPYGVEVFPDVEPGPRAITFSEDIGIGAPGDFTGAMKGRIGPYLLAANAAGGTAKPLVTIPGDTSGDQFLSDGVVTEFLTGSPFNTNYFEVCVDPNPPAGLDGLGNPCIRVDQFSLTGRVHNGAIGSPLNVTDATYARDAAAASGHVDVFANAIKAPNQAAPRLSTGDPSGTNAIPSVQMLGPTNLGNFYAQSIPADPAVLPAQIIVTNTADVPPTAQLHNLVDQVDILDAVYDPGSHILTIEAASSDEFDPPDLIGVGISGTFVSSAPGVGSFSTVLTYT